MDTNKVIIRPLIEIKEEANLIITEGFLSQIKYICSKISEVEWSGIVYFKTEGEPKDLVNFKVIPYYIHVMDKGDQSYTEFDDDGSAKALFEAMPELDPFSGEGFRTGKIHSHNTMSVFHSGTDMQDLQDQASAYAQYYLSIIVNNFMDIEAKMAFVAEIPDQRINPKGFVGAKWQLPAKEVLVTVDFAIEAPATDITIPEVLRDRVDEVIDKSKVSTGRNVHMGMGGLGLNDYEDEYDTLNNGFMTKDVTTYRSDQGKIVIRNFIHDYFKDEVPMGEVFEAVEAAPPEMMHDLNEAFVEHFKGLGNWSKQNIISFIDEVETPDVNSNIMSLYESIWATLKPEVT